MNLGARKTVGTLLVLGAFAGSVSGCGGGSGSPAATRADSSGATSQASTQGDSSSPPGNALSPARFVVQADAICKRVNRELASVKPKSGSTQEVERIVPRHAALERRGLASLEGLAAPSALARSWSALLADRRALASELDQLLEAAKRSDSAAAKALAASKKRVHQKLLKTATAAGFQDCARVG